jgi:hypothetical protein
LANPQNANALKPALSHVLWIGGATDAGKTSIVEMLVKTLTPLFYDKQIVDNKADITVSYHH